MMYIIIKSKYWFHIKKLLFNILIYTITTYLCSDLEHVKADGVIDLFQIWPQFYNSEWIMSWVLNIILFLMQFRSWKLLQQWSIFCVLFITKCSWNINIIIYVYWFHIKIIINIVIVVKNVNRWSVNCVLSTGTVKIYISCVFKSDQKKIVLSTFFFIISHKNVRSDIFMWNFEGRLSGKLNRTDLVI